MSSPLCNSVASLAELLHTTEQKLTYCLYRISDDRQYSSFQIPKKSGGFRDIDKPCGQLMSLQKNLNEFLRTHYSRKPCSHGFESDFGIKTNAEIHKNRKIVLNVDIEDFFGSINFGRVFGLFQSKPFFFPKNVAAAAAKLVTYKNKLPQGAPTSPILANMIALRLDSKLMSLAKKHSCTYTRYVDDVTFSSTKPIFDPAVASLNVGNSVTLGKAFLHIFEKEGFHIKSSKTRILTKFVRQDVTGLTVNEFVNVNRSYINSVFGMVYSWKKHGLEAAESTFLSKHATKAYKFGKDITPGVIYRSVVIGRISFIAHVRGWDDIVVRKLCVKFCEVDIKPSHKIGDVGKMPLQYDIFIGHASEQKDTIAKPLHKELTNLGINSFIDIVEIKWGESLTKIINRALSTSKYFLAIISSDSIQKSWPDKELNAALAREIEGKQKILPLFIGNDSEVEKLKDHYPLIADKVYKVWMGDPVSLAAEIKEILS